MEVKNSWLDDEVYRQIMDLMPIMTVDVLFFSSDKNKVLLFQRTNEPVKGEYYSIGGRLLKNEEFLAAALRQGEREVGLKLDPAKLVLGGVINEVFPNSPFPDINYHTVNVYWGYVLSASEEAQIRLDDQHAEYRWFSLGETSSCHPFIQERINNLVSKI